MSISCCGESNSQLNISNASVKNSFTDNELDADPEPTDYSQRYKERPIDDFIAPRCKKPEVIGSEDSVKVYITEGTPLNFSLASSLSDLREASLTAIDEEKNSLLAESENIDKCVQNEFNEQTQQKKNNDENIAKPVFKKPILPPKPKFITSPTKEVRNEMSDNKIQLETKSVTFIDNPIESSVSTNSIVNIGLSNENICEETPLMFSRSSSMGSLSDCEVKSDICQSSVVSEFRFALNSRNRKFNKNIYVLIFPNSRRQSAVVSPSELPDSPLDSPRPVSPKPISDQNIPTNNEKRNLKISFDSDYKENTDTVFEDKPMNFATEGTPAVFSHRTSLSSLTEELNICDNEENNPKIDFIGGTVEEKPMKSNESVEVDDIKADIISTSSEDEGEDELLAACISSGKRYLLFCPPLIIILFQRNEEYIE